MAKKQKKQKLVHQESLGRHIRKNWKLYSFAVIPILWYIIFKYIPMLGNIIAFRRYRGGPNIFGEYWVGFRYFEQFISDKSFWNAFWNTLRLSIEYLLVRFPATLIFAILINEIRNIKWKKTVQTISYLPHFVSLVVLCGMVKELTSLSGPINTLLSSLGLDKISFITEPAWFDTVYVVSGIWQALGWGTILYLTAMTGINTELYEAASIDGANRFKQILHITLPSLLPTIVLMTALNLGNILNAGFDQIFNLYNPIVYETGDIIDTYVYRIGMVERQYSIGTAVGLFKSVISFILIMGANKAAKKLTGSGIF